MHRPATRRHNPIIAELSGRYRTGTQYFVATQNESSRRLSAPQDGNAYAELQQLRFRPRIPALGLVRAVSRAGQKLNNLDEELE